jgi:hypothetical protein
MYIRAGISRKYRVTETCESWVLYLQIGSTFPGLLKEKLISKMCYLKFNLTSNSKNFLLRTDLGGIFLHNAQINIPQIFLRTPNKSFRYEHKYFLQVFQILQISTNK